MAASFDRYEIGTALEKDFSALPTVEVSADELFGRSGIGPLPPPANVDAYKKAAFVLVAGDPPIGFARVIEVDGEAHLEQMSVAPNHMCRGVGARLLSATIEAARELGYARLTLITFANVAWNAKFDLNRGSSQCCV